jgi:hypothetical protein
MAVSRVWRWLADWPRPLRRDQGTILLETALVLPVFLCLLCFCMDLPRFLSVKQRVIGASRLVAEVRIRNGGKNVVTPAQLGEWFFDDPSGQQVALKITLPENKYPLISGALKSLEDWLEGFLGKLFVGVIKFLANLATGGALEPYVLNVFGRDVFYGGRVDAEVKTLLPARAYAMFADDSGFKDTHTVSAVTYMPGCDSCKDTGTTFIGSMLDWLHDHFGL